MKINAFKISLSHISTWFVTHKERLKISLNVRLLNNGGIQRRYFEGVTQYHHT
jgi:hypothetical protein